MIDRTKVAAALGAAVALAVLATGCKSTSKQVEDFPKTVEATVEAKGPVEKVEFIDVTPWTARKGDTVNVRVGGTAGRTGTLTLACDNGVTKKVALAETSPGVYTAALPIDESLPPGKCRVEATLTGGPSGQPATLVSNRAVTIEAPPPPPPVVDPCDELRKSLADPRIGFAFNKDVLDEAARAFVAQAAAQIQGQGARVTRVVVEGHCDERGTTDYNLALGARRARNVANLLRGQAGMSGVTVETISKGEEAPLVPNAQTEEEHARNRRAVLLLECTPQK